MKWFLLLVLSLSLVGCATGQTPIGTLNATIDKIQTGKIHEMNQTHIQETLDWANALTDDTKKFAAKQCPEALQIAIKGHNEDMDKIQVKLTAIDERAKALANGDGINLLLLLTKAKYGEDYEAEIKAIKSREIERVTLIRNSCMNLIPEEKLLTLLSKFFGVNF